MNYWTQSFENKNIYVAAHRGWPAKYPENTLPSFEAAAKLGVDQIETDVRITKDGELVCIHDPKVDRTTNGTGLVCDLTLRELRALDAGSWKAPEFEGTKIPTIYEFFDLMKQYDVKTLDIELKEYPDGDWVETSHEVADRTLKIIDDYGYTDRVVINTFSAFLHEYIHEKYGNKYRLHTYWPAPIMGPEHPEQVYPYSYCCCLFGSDQNGIMATKDVFDYMRAIGVQPWAGAGCKTEEDVDAVIAHGADLITVNNPDEILAILRKKHYHE